MKVIIGPTSPVFGSPAAFVPNPPIPSTGVNPFSIKNAVINPHAINAAMFGIIIPDKNVPNFCTATRAPPDLLTPASAFTAMLCLRVEGRAGAVMPTWPAPRSVATSLLPRVSYGLPARPVQRRISRATSRSRRSGPMRVVRFYAPRDVRAEDAPEPTAGPGDLVIRVRNCSICGTDAKIWRSGHPDLRPPRVLGHEVAGEVVEVGEGAGGWSVGDRVQVIAAIPDDTCHECRNGWQTVCPNQERIGYQHDGGFAELMRVPAKVLAVDGVNRVPDGLSFAEASVAEPLSCVINGQEQARVGEGQTVVVVGAGPIGCLHVRLARARGAARVFLIELRPQRLELAAGLVAPDEAIGADTTDTVAAVRGLTGGRGADVIIVAAASAKAQEDGLQMAARRGRVSFFGGLPKDRPADHLRRQHRPLPRGRHRRGQRLQPGPQPGRPSP